MTLMVLISMFSVAELKLAYAKKVIYLFTLLKSPRLSGSRNAWILGWTGVFRNCPHFLCFSALPSPVGLIPWWRQEGCQWPQLMSCPPGDLSSQRRANPQWHQPESWKWASVSLPVWGHVPIPEPTTGSMPRGGDALTGPALELGMESIPPQLQEGVFKEKPGAFIPQRSLKPGRAIITDGFS